MKEALISFAAFSENNNKQEVALKLLDTYSSNYGDTVHTDGEQGPNTTTGLVRKTKQPPSTVRF